MRWSGTLTTVEAGTYFFRVKADAGFRLWINGVLRADYWNPNPVPTLADGDVNGDLVVDDADTQIVVDNFNGTLDGDANGDLIVDAGDINVVTSQWLQAGPGLEGDVNGDLVVDAGDVDYITARWLNTLSGDVNGDHLINQTDINVIIAHFGWPGVSSLFSIPGLAAASTYSIKLEFHENAGNAYAALLWKRPGTSSFVSVPSTQLGDNALRINPSALAGSSSSTISPNR